MNIFRFGLLGVGPEKKTRPWSSPETIRFDECLGQKTSIGSHHKGPGSVSKHFVFDECLTQITQVRSYDGTQIQMYRFFDVQRCLFDVRDALSHRVW